jgi:isocitrate/isopropylmalate dehydrogenase
MTREFTTIRARADNLPVDRFKSFESARHLRYLVPPMKIAVMPGDGVGKEVVPEGLKVLKEASRKFGFTYSTTDYPFGGEYYLETKITLPDSALKELAAHDAILFGAVGVDPRGSAQIPQGILETEILLKMRFELDQYINLRPTRLLPGVPTPLKNAKPSDIDMVIVRENTEGLYCQNGGFLYKGTKHEVANQIEVTTRHGVERAIRYAFDYARQFGRKKVTLVAKTNVLRYAHNLWLRAFEEIKTDYPGIATDYNHVDACTMYMVTKPQIYDVIVTTNMFGDSGRHGHGRQRKPQPHPPNSEYVRARPRQRAGYRGQRLRQPDCNLPVGCHAAGFSRSTQGRRRDQQGVSEGRRRPEESHAGFGRNCQHVGGGGCGGGGVAVESG